MVHLLKWHRIFRLRRRHGKVIVQAAFRTSVPQRPTSQRRAHSVVQEESNQVECQLSGCLGNSRWPNLGSHELWSATEGACGRTIPHILLAKSIIRDLHVTVKRQ